MSKILKLICEKCGTEKNVIAADTDEGIYDDLCESCLIKKIEYREMAILREQAKEQEYYRSLSSEQQAELRSEYALAGVRDAGEWFGY